MKTFAITASMSLALGVSSLTGIAHAGDEGTCLGEPVTIYADPDGGVLEGTEGPDVIFGSQQADQIDGKGGDDLICGRGGSDEINAGGEADRGKSVV